MQRCTRAVFFTTAIVALLVQMTLGSWVTPATAQSDIEVTTPAGGRFVPGQVTPLLVTIRADGATSGTITVTFEGQTTARQPYELAGGSSRQFVVMTPTPPWGGNGQISVSSERSDQPATRNFNLIPANNEEIVGLLPDLAAPGFDETADLAVEIGQARLFAVDTSLLLNGPDALSVFTHVAASAADVRSLDAEQLEATFAWVAGGGRLVIDDSAAVPLPGSFGSAVEMVDDERGRVGLGEILFTDGAIEASGFDGLLSPTPTRSRDELPFGGFGGMPASFILAADAGVKVPEIETIVFLLIGYAALAGPIAYVFFRRTNREPLLWLAVPALAALTTGLVWAAGSQLRDNVTAAHGTLVVDLPAGQIISTQALVSSPNGGFSGLDLGDNWRASAGSFEDFFEFGPGQVNQSATLRGDELVLDLPPGGVGVINAERSLEPGSADQSWDVDLQIVDGKLEGTITNLTTHTLEEVIVNSGRGADTVTSLGPGESADISMSNPGGFVFDRDPLMERMFNQDFSRANGPPVNPSVFSNWLSRNPSVRAPGNVLVVGWTREPAGPLSTDKGRSIANGRTGFVSVSAIEGTDTFDQATNRVSILRGFNGTAVSDPARGFEEFPLTVAITPATTTGDDNLVLDTPGFIAAMDVWDGSDWVPAGMAGLPPGASVVIDVPDGALDQGTFYVRMKLGDGWWNAADPLPQLRLEQPDDDVRTLGALEDNDA